MIGTVGSMDFLSHKCLELRVPLEFTGAWANDPARMKDQNVAIASGG